MPRAVHNWMANFRTKGVGDDKVEEETGGAGAEEARKGGLGGFLMGGKDRTGWRAWRVISCEQGDHVREGV